MLKGYIDEVFVSLQGEGILVGTPMVFLRFGGCSVGCLYCDTLRARDRTTQFIIDTGTPKAVANPVTASALFAEIKPAVERYKHLAVTGGEPLEQPAFLHLLLERLQDVNCQVLLESSGFYPDELSEVIEYVDVVSVDLKLPSFTGKPFNTGLHQQFLDNAREKASYCKVIVMKNTTRDEIREAAQFVAATAPNLPLILQPAFDETNPPTSQQVLYLMEMGVALSDYIDDVRVIPQLHKYVGIR
jgi:7-carboxy-7-deazaguanine synthase